MHNRNKETQFKTSVDIGIGYNGTSPYGHLYNMDTSLLRTVHLVPEGPKSI